MTVTQLHQFNVDRPQHPRHLTGPHRNASLNHASLGVHSARRTHKEDIFA